MRRSSLFASHERSKMGITAELTRIAINKKAITDIKR